MSKPNKYQILLRTPLPFSSSASQESYVTYESRAKGVVKLDDDEKIFILDFQVITLAHQYKTTSPESVDFKIIRIPYDVIVKAKLKSRYLRPSELVVNVNSQNAIKDVPNTRPGKIILMIEKADKRLADSYARALDERARNR